MKTKLLIIAVVLYSTITIAQSSISGKVLGIDAEPLIGATVYIPEFSKGTVTDHNGYYNISGIANSKVNIVFSYLGYSTEIKAIEFMGVSEKVDINLVQTSIETEAIVVSSAYSSSQHQNAVKIDVLKSRVQSDKPNPNFTKFLTAIPGVDMISKGNGVSKPVIRGLSMNDILVLNNGVRYENYQYSNHHPLGIDEFGIEAIEVIKGPASLLYGADAIGGVLNFIKESPAPIGTIVGDYNLQLHSGSLGIVNNLGLKGASNKFFGGVRFGQKSHADYLQGGGSFVPNSRFNEYSIKSNIGYVGNRFLTKLFYDYNSQDLGLVEEEAVEQIQHQGRRSEIFYQRLKTHLFSSQSKIFFKKSRVEFNTSYQNTELIHFGEKNVYELQMNLGTFIYESKYFFSPGAIADFILGFQGINQRNSNINERETILLPDAVSNSYSGFIFAQKMFREKVKIQAGVRYDYKTIDSNPVGDNPLAQDFRPSIIKDYSSFSGSVGGTYRLNKDLLFRINAASAFRNPNLAELTSNGPHETVYEIGDVNLVPEKSIEIDASTHYHTGNFLIDFALFRNSISNYIFISPTGNSTIDGLRIYQYKQGNSVLYGGETGIHLQPINSEWVQLSSTYSYVIGKQESGEYLPFIPAGKINFEISLRKKRLMFFNNVYLNLQPSFTFKQNHNAIEELKTKSYELIDMSFGGTIRLHDQNILVGFGINNLLDKKYIDHLSTLKEVNLFNPGRNISFSLHVPFGI